MKNIRYILTLTALMLTPNIWAQVMNLHTKYTDENGKPEVFTYYTADYDSIVMVPATNFGASCEIQNQYKDLNGQAHAVISVQAEKDADTIRAYFGTLPNYYALKTGTCEYTTLSKGSNTLDYILADTTQVYTLMVCTYNNRFQEYYHTSIDVEYDPGFGMWKNLGIGKFKEDFLDGTGTYYNVEIQQSTQNSNKFRLVKPWHAVAAGGGSYEPSSNISKYMELEIMKDTFDFDMVTFPNVNTGYHYSAYDADIYVVCPWSFAKLKTETYMQYNKVVEYQENGLPSEIELAPYYYMFGTGGWNKTQYEGIIDILFPKAQSNVNKKTSTPGKQKANSKLQQIRPATIDETVVE